VMVHTACERDEEALLRVLAEMRDLGGGDT
jgi:hypothetical protein